MDDMLFICNNKVSIGGSKHKFLAIFDMKDLEATKYVHGMDYIESNGWVRVSLWIPFFDSLVCMIINQRIYQFLLV